MIKYNPSIFDINPNCETVVQEIGNLKSRLLTINNIFKDPERVSSFLRQIPLVDNITSDPNKIKGFYPGYQTYFLYDLGEFSNLLFFYANQTFGTNLRGWHSAYQCIDGKKEVYNQCNLPHTDGGQLAGNVFLSKTVEEESGTRFYRFNKTNEESPIGNNCSYRKQRYSYSQPDVSLTKFEPITNNENWSSYHLAEESYNSFNMYEGALFHSAFIKTGTYTSHLRESLSVLSQS